MSAPRDWRRQFLANARFPKSDTNTPSLRLAAHCAQPRAAALVGFCTAQRAHTASQRLVVQYGRQGGVGGASHKPVRQRRALSLWPPSRRLSLSVSFLPHNRSANLPPSWRLALISRVARQAPLCCNLQPGWQSSRRPCGNSID